MSCAAFRILPELLYARATAAISSIPTIKPCKGIGEDVTLINPSSIHDLIYRRYPVQGEMWILPENCEPRLTGIDPSPRLRDAPGC